MKVCYVCCEYPPALHGGIGTYVQTLGRALVRSGDQVRVAGIYPRLEGPPEYEEDQGVRVWRWRYPKPRIGWIAARYRLFRAVRQWVSRGEVDLIEVPDWEGLAALWPRLGVPVVVRLHGSLTYFASEMASPNNPRAAWLESKSFHRADYCCSTSAYTANKTQQIFGRHPESAEVLYCPVDMSNAMEPARRDRSTVVFAGSLTKKKGIIQLIKAWPRVLAKDPGVHLHIYGKDAGTDDGHRMQPFLLSLLEPKARESVHFHGHIPTGDLRNIYRSCRVCVFPSYSEAFSLAPVEAMAAGCPVVYSTRHSGPELMTHEVNGLLVDPDDEAELARSVWRFVESDALAARIGEAGRRHVYERYSAEHVKGKNREFYQHCIDKFRHGKGRH